jgi:hypothetical protein
LEEREAIDCADEYWQSEWRAPASQIRFDALCTRRRASRDCCLNYQVSEVDNQSFFVSAAVGPSKTRTIVRIAYGLEDVVSWEEASPGDLASFEECGCRRLRPAEETPLFAFGRAFRPLADAAGWLLERRPFKPDYGLSRAMRYDRGIPLCERNR